MKIQKPFMTYSSVLCCYMIALTHYMTEYNLFFIPIEVYWVDLGLEMERNSSCVEQRMGKNYGSDTIWILLWSYLFGIETLHFSPYKTSILQIDTNRTEKAKK